MIPDAFTSAQHRVRHLQQVDDKVVQECRFYPSMTLTGPARYGEPTRPIANHPP